MDLVRALVADLRDLAVDLAVDVYTGTTIAMIEHALRRTVPSALGASVTLRTPVSPQTPVVVNFVARVISPDEIGAVLVVPLPGVPPPRSASITFYAGQAGAFRQLVLDLVGELYLDPVEIEHDAPLPSTPVVPRIEGLRDFSTLNRALGVLLNRGHTLESAQDELARRAERTSTDVSVAAAAILASAHY